MDNVWDYPRPPAVEPCPRHVRIELAGQVLGDSHHALRVLETSHPPTIYVPYPQPASGYEALTDHLAFYPERVDAAWLDDERAVAQEGDFYGGWITAELLGPFKGAPGTRRW